MGHFKVRDPIYINGSVEEYIKLKHDQVVAVINPLNVSKIDLSSNKEKKKVENKKELNEKNLMTAMNITLEIMKADPEMAMNQLMSINEKVKTAAKLKELGYKTKEERKYIHDAIRYYKSKIKELGINGAAEDTAEKYLVDASFIKKINGFQNKQKQNRFK